MIMKESPLCICNSSGWFNIIDNFIEIKIIWMIVISHGATVLCFSLIIRTCAD